MTLSKILDMAESVHHIEILILRTIKQYGYYSPLIVEFTHCETSKLKSVVLFPESALTNSVL